MNNNANEKLQAKDYIACGMPHAGELVLQTRDLTLAYKKRSFVGIWI